jgi:hypothetical protein
MAREVMSVEDIDTRLSVSDYVIDTQISYNHTFGHARPKTFCQVLKNAYSISVFIKSFPYIINTHNAILLLQSAISIPKHAFLLLRRITKRHILHTKQLFPLQTPIFLLINHVYML